MSTHLDFTKTVEFNYACGVCVHCLIIDMLWFFSVSTGQHNREFILRISKGFQGFITYNKCFNGYAIMCIQY